MLPRLLTKDEAAAYCGLKPRQFQRHVAKHVRAVRFGREKRWDTKAIDAYLDGLAGRTDDDILKTLDDFGRAPLRHRQAKQERH